MFSIKSLIPTYPLHRLGTSQTGDGASEPSGFHPFSSCPCNLVNTFQMSLMEIMCGVCAAEVTGNYCKAWLGRPSRPKMHCRYYSHNSKACTYSGWGRGEMQKGMQERENADLLSVNTAVCLALSLLQRELLDHGAWKVSADTLWLAAKSLSLNKPIKVL